MGAGIAASPHCPSYRRRRVAWRLPLGGSGRGRSEPRAVPRWVGSALARGPSPSGSRTRHRARPRTLPGAGGRGRHTGLRVVPAGGRSLRAGSVGSGLGASPSTFASASDRSELRSSTFGVGSKRTPILHLRRPGRSKLRFLQPFGLDRGEPRSSAANGDRAEALIFTRSASPPEQAPRVRPGDARIEASPDPPSPARAGRSPLSPAGPEEGQAPPRSGSGRSEASSGPDPSAFASAGRFPLPLGRLQHLRPKPRATAGRLPEIRPGIRLRLCWPGFFHRPAESVTLIPFEGKKPLLSAASGWGRGRFRPVFPPVHESEAVMECDSLQADSACG